MMKRALFVGHGGRHSNAEELRNCTHLHAGFSGSRILLLVEKDPNRPRGVRVVPGISSVWALCSFTA